MDLQLLAYIVQGYLPLRARCCGAGPEDTIKIEHGGWYAPNADAAVRLFVSPNLRATLRVAPLCTEDVTPATVWWWLHLYRRVSTSSLSFSVRIGDAQYVDDATLISLPITELLVQPQRAVSRLQQSATKTNTDGTADAAIRNVCWTTVTGWIAALPSMTRLTWSITDVSPLQDALERRCQGAANTLQALTHLDVSFCSLGDVAVAHLVLVGAGSDNAAATVLLPHLKLLNIQSNRVGSHTVDALTSPSWSTSWTAGPHGATGGPASPSTENAAAFALETLDVSNNKLTGALCDALGAGLLKRLNNTLRHLVLRRNALGDTNLATFAAALSNVYFLGHLDLQHCNLKCAQVVSLCSHLATTAGGGRREHRFLKTLLLRSNTIGKEGAHALASALPSMASLTHLDVGCNPAMGDEAVAAIVGSLRTLQHLDVLNLGRTGAGRLTAEALVAFMTEPLEQHLLPTGGGGGPGSVVRHDNSGGPPRCYHSLDVLELENNAIDDAGAIALVAALILCHGRIVERLDLSRNAESLDFGAANAALYNLRALKAAPSPRCVLW